MIVVEKKRLSKVLASAGIASRRACETLIFAGRVSVNGSLVKIPQTLVSLEQDCISVDGERIQKKQEKVYYVLNKPKGYICSSSRIGKQPIVLDLFANFSQRLFTIGRLDKETTGLLLVTNDGWFANQVIHPSSQRIKEYLVKTAQEITPDMLKILSEGACIDGKWVRPASVRKIRRGTFRICLKEGRKHEVRIIAERAALDVLELTRIRIGSLLLGSLPEGCFRPLSKKERDALLGGIEA